MGVVLAVGSLIVCMVASAQAASLPRGATDSGPAYQLIFSTQPPATTTADQPFIVVVSVEDQAGNVVTNESGRQISVGIIPGTGSAGSRVDCTDGGTGSVEGVDTFSCELTGVGSTYQLGATSLSLVSAVSTIFASSGTPDEVLGMTVPLTPPVLTGTHLAIRVEISDWQGTLQSGDSTDVVTLTLESGGGAPVAAELVCGTTDSATVTGGVANFDCQVNGPGTFEILATSTYTTLPIRDVTSNTFAVQAGPAAKLTFGDQPPLTSPSGTTLTPVVREEDAFGNVVVTDNADGVSIGLTPGSGTTGAKLLCGSPLGTTLSLGTAEWSCFVNEAGVNYSLTASSTNTSIDPAVTQHFAATGMPTLTFVTPPPGAVAADQQFTVGLLPEDGSGAPMDLLHSPLSLSLSGGSNGVRLVCASSSEIEGTGSTGSDVTLFSCHVTQPGSGYELVASTTGLTSSTSLFTVTPAHVQRLVVASPPTKVAASVPFSIRVSALDSLGAIVQTTSTPVTLSATAVTLGQSTKAALRCGADPVVPVKGTATFTCSIAATGASDFVSATSAGTPSARSPGFFSVVSHAPVKLAFVSALTPSVDVRFSISVAVQDTLGNLVTDSKRTISPVHLALVGGGKGAVLRCVANPSKYVASKGTATFRCEINKTNIGYHLVATSSGLTSVTSPAFFVT
jgi:hypothetical protein